MLGSLTAVLNLLAILEACSYHKLELKRWWHSAGGERWFMYLVMAVGLLGAAGCNKKELSDEATKPERESGPSRSSVKPRYDELRSQITAAIRQAADELRNSTNQSGLFGFALCTDDEVRTLFHVACTRDWVREKEVKNPDIGYLYNEWTLTASDAKFDLISQQFGKLADQDFGNPDWGSARDERFKLLELALADCRKSGVFDSDTLLCAGSTDPSEHLQALDMKCVDALNTLTVASRYAKALGYEKHRKANR